MASVQIAYSGQYIRNSTGGTAGGALLYVYDAQTLDLASIYTDASLVTASANPVTADSAGLMPFAWKGTGDYKVILKTSGGVTLDEQDNIPGAVESDSGTAEFARPQTPVIVKTADYTTTTSDLGKVINCTVTGGTIQITLLSAVTAEDGAEITLRHTGTANQVKIVTTSAQTITHPAVGVTVTAFSLVGYGEAATFVSDGANWHVKAYVPPLMSPNTPGVIKITDRLSAPPSSPDPGARYLLTSSPSGNWSSFAEHDIAEATGQDTWFKYTPPSDCGWIAYVQDEDAYYARVGSSWVISAVNVNGLTEDTNPDSSSSGDFISIWDTSASAHKKLLLGSVPGALLGLIEDRKSAGTGPGSLTSNAWTKRDLNTETYDRLGIISVASNQFTISAAGTYEIQWESPFYSSSGAAKTRLYNATAGSEVDVGTQGGWAGGTGATQFYSRGIARVTIASSTAFEIQYHQSSTSGGQEANKDSKNEIYTRVIIRRG